MKRSIPRCATLLAALTLTIPGAVLVSERAATADQDKDRDKKKMTDAQILGVLNAVNDGFIERSKTETGSKNANVKELAQSIVDDHKEAKSKQADLAKKQNISPTEPKEAKSIRDETTDDVTRLKKLDGADRDKAFVDMMVTEYDDRLQNLDDVVIPSIMDKQLREHITTSVRPMMADNLARARQVSKQLEGPPRPSSAR